MFNPTLTRLLVATAIPFSLVGVGSPAIAQHRDQGAHQRQAFGTEPEREPRGYPGVQRPTGADARPHDVDRRDYNHNFVANHAFAIGPYHPPRGYHYRRWAFGQILPPAFWARDYWIADYWLFGLDVPPFGLEWVRYGPDALLVDTRTGEVIQVVYGRFL